MIIFLIGFMALIFGVAGIEGTLPIFLGILISILGGSMMLWGINPHFYGLSPCYG